MGGLICMAKQATLRITQVKSVIGAPRDQKATVKALGLKRINHTVEQPDTPEIRGMVFKVKHLVTVDEG
ncbi:MAG: 50S ribosomal protein L30 [Coriobacteriia bacterium]